MCHATRVCVLCVVDISQNTGISLCCMCVVDISQNTGISLEHVTLTLNLLRLASNKDTGSVCLPLHQLLL